MDRRGFLTGTAMAVAPCVLAGANEPSSRIAKLENARNVQGLIARQKQPDNLEPPFSSLDSFLTPNEQFFIRTHFETPELNVADWNLRIEGHVQRPSVMTYDELLGLDPRTVTSLVECSGNSRVFLVPAQPGIQWEQGAVGTAEWTGTSLWELLEHAGIKTGAVEVILEGYDQGTLDYPNPPSPGKISFARSLPLEKAHDVDVLLAWKMNGVDLSPAHGYPVRVIVPDWYGMASVKWLRRIIVTNRPFAGYFQTLTYSTWERETDGVPSLKAVSELDVKAQIARPSAHEVVPTASDCIITGAAWAGRDEVVKVQVSVDGGQSWHDATLAQERQSHSWRWFQYPWRTPKQAGTHLLMARATDAAGRIQTA